MLKSVKAKVRRILRVFRSAHHLPLFLGVQLDLYSPSLGARASHSSNGDQDARLCPLCPSYPLSHFFDQRLVGWAEASGSDHWRVSGCGYDHDWQKILTRRSSHELSLHGDGAWIVSRYGCYNLMKKSEKTFSAFYTSS